MNIVKAVAKARLHYHANLLDVFNVANQLGLLNDERAEEIMKKHTLECFDALEHMGLDLTGLEKKE